ncbi:hypothetical protein CHLRE_09g393876v5 [Chlamydomonas reinhardtii]|uniref:tRNA/rRNA methyltransferase SpoU type domain-containing protein n=1 Tax=Chlamydomonas reinhardtii TaxID=3055 RepID=A0A2K3DED9_CHLRE|nr:uncharacterized protein CHLRE_09g393876v5 [Chlamydomonas reinhardtii]PNW78901.1 hypothetical protein CHLRE_09g393876v5 [Chlamydomonas reinhardtii]
MQSSLRACERQGGCGSQSSKTRFGCRAHALASWTAAAWGRGAAGPTATARLRAVAKSTATPAPATSISSSTPHEAPQLAAGSGPPSPAASGPALPHDLLLSDVRVVLVAPKHEANIGAVARAAANFECLNLYIVAPRCDGAAAGWTGEARKVACGDSVLDRAVVVDTLEQALADTSSSIGFTRRTGAARRTHASLGHLLAEFPFALPLQPPPVAVPTSAAAAGPCATALVFGREESGLTEAELRLCSYASAIPTGRVQPSMNLSHAVAAVLAELFSRRCGLLAVASAVAVDEAAAAVDAAGIGGGGGGSGSGGASEGGSGSGTRPLLRMPVGGSAAEDARVSTSLPPGATAAAAIAAAGLVGGRHGGGGSVVPAEGAGEGAGAGVGAPDAGMLPASAQEVELLLRKVAAIAEAVGMSGAESKGGGNNGNHGRRRLPLGHLRAVVSRARVNAAESRSLHGLASGVLQRLEPGHPLEARKAQRKQEQQKEPQAPGGRQEQQPQEGRREQEGETAGKQE